MPPPRRGEVWLIDIGLAGNIRPALVVSVAFGTGHGYPPHDQFAWFVFRDCRADSIPQTGAFQVQGVATSPTISALHRLGTLPRAAFDKVLGGLLSWLGHIPQ
jgi:mRNA interferase MazF